MLYAAKKGWGGRQVGEKYFFSHYANDLPFQAEAANWLAKVYTENCPFLCYISLFNIRNEAGTQFPESIVYLNFESLHNEKQQLQVCGALGRSTSQQISQSAQREATIYCLEEFSC